MKNEKGFTLVELLAVMVILGILMAVAIPNVTGILYKNRSVTYISDAKKMASAADYKFRGSSGNIVKPANNQCIIMTLSYVDNSEFESPPNDGSYMKTASYVIIKNEGGTYKFYTKLIEDINKNGNNTYRGVKLAPATGNNSLESENSDTKLIVNFKDNEKYDLADISGLKRGSDVRDEDYLAALENFRKNDYYGINTICNTAKSLRYVYF